MSWPVFLCVLQLFWIKNPCLFIFSSPYSWIPVQQRDRIIHPKDERILLHGDAACACALSRWNLPFVEFAGEFCGLAAVSELHDAAILHLFRLGANYQSSMDLPDTTGLCWREGIYRCLGSYRSRVETSPRVSPLAPPSSSSSPLVPSSSSSSSLVLPSSSSLVPPSSSSSLLVPSSSSSSPLVLPSASSSPLVLPSSSSLVQLVFVSAGSAQFCATRAPPGTPGLVSGLWGDGLEPSTRACSSPAPSGACSSPAPSSACSSPAPSGACSSPAPSSANSSQVLSSSSAGPAQLIFVAAGSVQLSRASRRFSASRALPERPQELVLSSSPLPPLVPSSSPLPPLVPSSSPLPPLVPSSSPLPPLVPSSSPWPPLVLFSSPATPPEHPPERMSFPNNFFGGGLPSMAAGVPGSAVAAWVPGSAVAAWVPGSAVAAWVPWSAMAAWVPWSAMAAWVPWSAMAAWVRHLPCLQVPWGLQSAPPLDVIRRGTRFWAFLSAYDSPCMTWTVYWTLNLRCLPTVIISALFTDYPECLPPAPIISLNSDSDSALPTLCLKLVFELCLSDLLFVLIKLLLDLTTLPLRYKNKGASRCLEEHFFFLSKWFHKEPLTSEELFCFTKGSLWQKKVLQIIKR